MTTNTKIEKARTSAALQSADVWHLTVTDLKQWDYCPRVVFFSYCMPRLRPITYKMQAGVEEHEDEKLRERRRTGQIYGLTDAERIENVWLESDDLGLRGRIDLVLRRGDEAWPVEYKLSRQLKIADHFKLQLAAYALLIEEQWQVSCNSGFLYSLTLRRAESIPITGRLRKRTRSVIDEIRAMIAAERMPNPTSQRGCCVNCEFRRFCNDVF